MTARDEAIPLVVRIDRDGEALPAAAPLFPDGLEAAVEAIAVAVIATANGAAPQEEEALRDPDKGARLDAAPIDQDVAVLLEEVPATGILPAEVAGVAGQADVILVAADPTVDARGVRLLAAPIDQDRLLAAFGEDRELPLLGGLGQHTPDPLDGEPGI